MSEKEELEPEEKEKMRKLRKRVGSLDYSITYDVITEELKFWYSEYIESTFLRKNGTVKKVILESFVFLWKPAHLEHLLQAYFWGLPACLQKEYWYILPILYIPVHTRYIVYSGTRVRYYCIDSYSTVPGTFQAL